MKHKTCTINHSIDNTAVTRPPSIETANLRDFAAEVLGLLNQTSNCSDLIKNILFLIKVVTGLEAAGLRLREGDDFPYYETLGFSKEFVEAERSLCSHDQTGAYTRDSQGNIYLNACVEMSSVEEQTPLSRFLLKAAASGLTAPPRFLLLPQVKTDRVGLEIAAIARGMNRWPSSLYATIRIISAFFS